MTIPREALDLITSFEGYHRRLADDRAAPYLCPAKVWTIGYGSIWLPGNGAGGRVPVTADTPPIDRERAAALLAWELAQCERSVDRLIARPLPPLSRGALVSFTYNLGAGALQGSALRRVVNSGQWSRVPDELAKWRMAGGVVLAGLVRRRAAEAVLFMRGIHANDNPTPVGHRARPVGNGRAGHGWAARVFPAHHGAAAA